MHYVKTWGSFKQTKLPVSEIIYERKGSPYCLSWLKIGCMHCENIIEMLMILFCVDFRYYVVRLY